MQTNRGLQQSDINAVREALGRISSIADRDCDCDWSNGSPSDPDSSCDTCQAELAARHLEKVLQPRWESCSPERMTNIEERIYVEQWRKRNKRVPSLNGGYGTLELLLVKEFKRHWLHNRRIPVVEHVSQRDMEVATSVIQWLGTNCGSGFINECERKVAEAKDIKRRFVTNQWGNYYSEMDPSVAEVADHIACRFISVDKTPGAAKALARAISSAIMEFMTSSAHGESEPKTQS